MDTDVVDVEQLKARLCPEDPYTPPEIGVLVNNYLNSVITTLIDDPLTHSLFSDIGARAGEGGGLCPAYSSWLLDAMNDKDLDRAQSTWKSRRETSRKLPLTAMPEAFEDINRLGTVTLALFNGNNIDCDNLLAIKEVSPEDLSRMG